VVEALVVQAGISELTRVYDWAETLGRRFDVPQSTLFAIQLCFEEALSNIARFGFADVENEVPRNTDVRLTVEPRGDQIVATIEDHGDAFDPLGVAAPAQPTVISDSDVPLGGRGIHLMRQFAQSLRYERREDINRLTLSFAYRGEAVAPPGRAVSTSHLRDGA
jgi:anti-sigma regulatory factor (Ser/Thr protein kinase)